MFLNYGLIARKGVRLYTIFILLVVNLLILLSLSNHSFLHAFIYPLILVLFHRPSEYICTAQGAGFTGKQKQKADTVQKVAE